MQVTGGLVLATMGWNLLNAPDSDPAEHAIPNSSTDEDLRSLEEKAFYPFTFPITAGPGCIVVIVTLSAQASAQRGFADVAAHAGIALAVASLSAAVYVCYGFAPRIAARVRPQTAHGILRAIAFVLVCIGAQISWNGVELLIQSLPAR
jgi:multiple antibiotic resistance protein